MLDETHRQRPINGHGSYPADAALSPSLLWPIGDTASYEVKFLIPSGQAADVTAWAGKHLALDPHADAALGDAYRITSIYLDTPGLDVFHRTPTYKRRKFRLRRYGTEHGIYLERKTKSGDRVRKRRTLIPDQELVRLREPSADPAWPAYWYHRLLLERGLAPRCLISYERVAHVGMSADGPIRLTLDRNIRCTLTDGYHFSAAGPAHEPGTNGVARAAAGLPLLAEEVVLELKFREALPALFKDLIHDMRLQPAGVSKYRLGIAAWGLANVECGAGRRPDQPPISPGRPAARPTEAVEVRDA